MTRSYLGSATAPSCGNSFKEQLEAMPTFLLKENTENFNILKEDFNGLSLSSKILLKNDVVQHPADKQKKLSYQSGALKSIIYFCKQS